MRSRNSRRRGGLLVAALLLAPLSRAQASPEPDGGWVAGGVFLQAERDAERSTLDLWMPWASFAPHRRVLRLRVELERPLGAARIRELNRWGARTGTDPVALIVRVEEAEGFVSGGTLSGRAVGYGARPASSWLGGREPGAPPEHRGFSAPAGEPPGVVPRDARLLVGELGRPLEGDDRHFLSYPSSNFGSITGTYGVWVELETPLDPARFERLLRLSGSRRGVPSVVVEVLSGEGIEFRGRILGVGRRPNGFLEPFTWEELEEAGVRTLR